MARPIRTGDRTEPATPRSRRSARSPKPSSGWSARGRLYDFHQLVGRADLLLGEAVDALAAAGHASEADLLRRDILGRNVLPGRWTFQVVEEFDAGYWTPFRDAEQAVRDALLEGRPHVHESELKESRRTPGRPGHESRP